MGKMPVFDFSEDKIGHLLGQSIPLLNSGRSICDCFSDTVKELCHSIKPFNNQKKLFFLSRLLQVFPFNCYELSTIFCEVDPASAQLFKIVHDPAPKSFIICLNTPNDILKAHAVIYAKNSGGDYLSTLR